MIQQLNNSFFKETSDKEKTYQLEGGLTVVDRTNEIAKVIFLGYFEQTSLPNYELTLNNKPLTLPNFPKESKIIFHGSEKIIIQKTLTGLIEIIEIDKTGGIRKCEVDVNQENRIIKISN